MSPTRTDVELLEEISAKLNVLISLGMELVDHESLGSAKKRKQGVGPKARLLAGFGLDPRDIASIIGAPLSSVRTLLTPGRSR